MVSVGIGDWGNLWQSSSLCCGCCGADPCGPSSVGFEGWLCALFSLLCHGPLRMVFSLLPSSDNNCCCDLCSHVICIGWDEPSLDIFMCDGFVRIVRGITTWFMVGLVEVCCFIVSLWSSSFSWCRCWSSVLYTMISRGLWIIHIKCDGAYFVQAEPHVIEFKGP